MHNSGRRTELELMQHHGDHLHQIRQHPEDQHEQQNHNNHHHHPQHVVGHGHMEQMHGHMDEVLHSNGHGHGHDSHSHSHDGEYALDPLGAVDPPSSSGAQSSSGNLMHLQPLRDHVLASAASGHRKRPASRPIHVCWGYFTDDSDPWHSKSAVCKHCHKEVLYWKKAQTVLGHLKGCQPFRAIMEAVEDAELVPQFVQEWQGLQNFKRAKLSAAENQKRLDEAFSFLHMPQKVLSHRAEVLAKILDEYGVETADDLRFLDEARRNELAKCLKFVPERRFLELLSSCPANG
jgi:hypothetical protein